MSDFQGFPPGTLKFLRQLAKNNNRDWFQENKDRYERDWLEPSLAFIEAIEKPLKSFSPCFPAVAKRVGGSLMRIYRDTRFAKDKTPYKTNIGIHFRHQSGSDVHAPGLYVHISPGEIFLGAGVWRPDSKTAKAIRARIDEEPDQWKKATRGKTFASTFQMSGESLKRPPQGYDADHAWIDDLKRKDFIGVHNLTAEAIARPDFAKETVALFKKAKPFVRFLCESISVPF